MRCATRPAGRELRSGSWTCAWRFACHMQALPTEGNVALFREHPGLAEGLQRREAVLISAPRTTRSRISGRCQGCASQHQRRRASPNFNGLRSAGVLAVRLTSTAHVARLFATIRPPQKAQQAGRSSARFCPASGNCHVSALCHACLERFLASPATVCHCCSAEAWATFSERGYTTWA